MATRISRSDLWRRQAAVRSFRIRRDRVGCRVAYWVAIGIWSLDEDDRKLARGWLRLSLYFSKEGH